MPKCRSGFKVNVVRHRTGHCRQQADVVDATPLPMGRPTRTIARPCDDVDTANRFVELQDESDMVVPPATKYNQTTTEEVDAWRCLEEELVKVKMETEVPIINKCTICECIPDQPIRCLDCGRFVVYCNNCESEVHKSVWHKPEIWQVREEWPLPVYCTFWITHILTKDRLTMQCF